MIEDRLPERADRRRAASASDGSGRCAAELPAIREVRGKGLLIGIDLDAPAGPVVDACRDARPARADRRREGPAAGAAAHRRRARRRPRASRSSTTRSGRPSREALPLDRATSSAKDVDELFAPRRRAEGPAEGARRRDAARRPHAGPRSSRSRRSGRASPSRSAWSSSAARAVYLAGQEIGLGTRESVPDVARNLSRWVDVRGRARLRARDRRRARAARRGCP